jgi:DNA-binding transcriptional LysR family regulator
MAVTDEQLRCFQCAAQTLNFTKAAELCFVTQPAFSRIIAALEAEWGVTLFERSTRKMHFYFYRRS